MRLLSTNTHRLTEFQNNIPPYAILSHVWQWEEVTFRDIVDLEMAKQIHGFAKIVGACNTAKRDGFEYIWIDTCCINKESSSELSEAINSMYTWYKNARVCYAYLWDVPSEGDNNGPPSLFAMSMWFTRGWTLQELIAPPKVVFYARDWVDIGTKCTLQEVISAVTGIGIGVITGGVALDDMPVAVRMSWAADRKTTREEDIAYSLMGVFDVNMPLLYGEGKKAFIRLQHEIIKKSNDHSIFAWTEHSDRPRLFTTDTDTHRGILARSPREFHHSGEVERIPQINLGLAQPNDCVMNSPAPYSITNQGLYIELPTVFAKDKTLAFLNCRLSGQSGPIAIVLAWSHHLQQYIRLETKWRETTGRGSARLSLLYIAQDYQAGSHRISAINLDLEVKVPLHYTVPNVISSGSIHSKDGRIVRFNALYRPGGTHLLVFNELHEFKPFAVVFGAHDSGVVWCNILTDVIPVGRSDKEIIAAYRAVSDAHWPTKMPFLDRASASLANGWSVAVSLALPMPFKSALPGPGSRYYAEIEIIESQLQQQRPAPLLARPSVSGTAYLVIPPTPQHGFVVDTDNIHRASPDMSWVQHLHSLILSRSENSGPVELPFKNTTTRERFYLVLQGVCSSIEKETLRIPYKQQSKRLGVMNRRWSGSRAEAYSTNLGNGKSIFVTQRQCKDKSVADYIITLSM